jgi:SAM-dependent methyltransferase
MLLGNIAIKKLIKDYSFETVLDVGSGKGAHSDIFLNNNKKVTAVDIGNSEYFQSRKTGFDDIDLIVGDFNNHNFGDIQFDCVWASHILEHQRNVGLFLEKIISLTKEGGVICISVPPMKTDIVGGHLTFWNGGLLLYNLVLCGLDCSNASVLRYGYNISIILKKKTIDLPNNLSYDIGDIEKMKHFFPNDYNYQGFNGNIQKINWE